jgi:hypothetical protein
MSGSKKILLFVTLTFLVAMVLGLFMLRNELQTVLVQETKINFKEIDMGKFENIDCSANWNLRIVQGRAYKVEWAVADENMKPTFVNINNTLFIEHDTAVNMLRSARITIPFLRNLQIGEGTILSLESFETDSLHIVLEKNAKYLSKENNVKFQSIKTKGESEIQMITDPMN